MAAQLISAGLAAAVVVQDPIFYSSPLSTGRRAQACSPSFGTCLDTLCCQQEGFGCFKRPNRIYATCMSVPVGGCEDSDAWLCPGWWDAAGVSTGAGSDGEGGMPVNLEPPVNLDPHYLAIAHCSEEAHKCGRDTHPAMCQTPEYQNCLETHCCRNLGFKCFEKKGYVAAATRVYRHTLNAPM